MKAKRQFEIYADYNSYYSDEKGISLGGRDDVIESYEEKGYPSFKIVVPGISEWQNRYQDATDFAEVKTDPSFDWRSWHREGLLFAKAVYEQLPRCYNLIYRRPFEDRSGLLESVDLSKDPVDDIISSLGSDHHIKEINPSYKVKTSFEMTWLDSHSFSILFMLGPERYLSESYGINDRVV